jgi:hypothetical protein
MKPNEKQYLDEAIEAVAAQFSSYPNIFLTEDDLRIHLCAKLSGKFSKIEKTSDDDFSISLHTEIRWYGNGKLKWRSDIVLIDVSTLRVLNRKMDLPSKGYGFNMPKAIVELKLRRPNGPSDNAFSNAVENDRKKLLELKRIFDRAGGGDTEYRLVVFDKKKDVGEKISRRKNIGVTYRYADQSEQ